MMVERAMRGAVDALLARQQPDGHWDGPPDSDSAADHILRKGPRVRDAAAAILAREPEWAGVKGYAALKAAGVPVDDPRMVALRGNILALGGAERASEEVKDSLRARGLYPEGIAELFAGPLPPRWRNTIAVWKLSFRGNGAAPPVLEPVWDTAMAVDVLEKIPEPPVEAIARARAWLGSRTPLPGGRGPVTGAQQFDGSWPSGRGFLHGTCFALRALRDAGESDREAHVLRAGEWLRSIQNSDGGWGEACAAEFTPGPSKPCETAWALLGLMAGGDTCSRSVHDGITHLVNTQLPGGDWNDPYTLYFPLLALSEFFRL